jgi:hypothetical protein
MKSMISDEHQCVALESMFVDESWMDDDAVEGVRCRLQWTAMFVDESGMYSDKVEVD